MEIQRLDKSAMLLSILLYNERTAKKYKRHDYKSRNNGAILEMEIYRSGKTIDDRPVLRKDIREIANNTNKYIIPKGVTIPLKFGHDDRNQELKGEVLQVSVKRRRRKNTNEYELSLIASVLFYDAALELWNANKLKNVSVEIFENGVSESGESFGKYLGGLALLGIDPPAIPYLKTEFNEADYLSVCNDMEVASVGITQYSNGEVAYYSRQPVEKQKSKKGQYSMDPEKFQGDELEALIDQLTISMEANAAAMEIIEKLKGSEPDAEEPAEEPAEEANTETETEEFDKDARIADLEKQIADYENSNSETELELAFSNLHAAGKVNQSDKELFTSLANDTTLAAAVKHYSKSRGVKTPPLTPKSTDSLKSSAKADPKDIKYQQYYEEYKISHPRLSDEKKQARARIRASVELARNGGGKNGSN